MSHASVLVAICLASVAGAQTLSPSPPPAPDAPTSTTTLPLTDSAPPGSGPDVPTAATAAATSATASAPVVPAPPAWPAHGVPPVGTWDVVGAGALGAALLAVQFAVPAPTVPKWTEQNGFDTGIRSALRISGEGGRQAAAYTSDGLVYLLVAAPFLNSILVAGVEHERWDVGWRLAVLDAQALFLAGTITITLQKAVGRERPFVQECKGNPALKDCSGGGANQSFPSGHTSAAFAAVALECFHHGYLDTSHTGWGAAVCPVTVVAAIAAGVLRISADRHWATDVLAGAAIGGLVGYAVPALHLLGEDKQQSAVLMPTISPTTMGVTLAGRF